jgi:endonuclease/exonuclease/phosphatase (EEP) superfamily protein YafD
MHGADQWRQRPTQGNLNISRVPLNVLMWNVRGLNAPKKQQYLDWLITEQKPDIVMLNETKLTSPLFLGGYYAH